MVVTQVEFAGVQFELGELKGVVVGLENRVGGLKNKISWSEAEFGGARPVFDELKTRVGGLSENLGAMRMEIVWMQGRLSVFETVVPRSETDGLKTVIDEINAKIAEMNGAISQIVLRIADANKHIDQFVRIEKRFDSRSDSQFAKGITRLDLIMVATVAVALATVGLTILALVAL